MPLFKRPRWLLETRRSERDGEPDERRVYGAGPTWDEHQAWIEAARTEVQRRFTRALGLPDTTSSPVALAAIGQLRALVEGALEPDPPASQTLSQGEVSEAVIHAAILAHETNRCFARILGNYRHTSWGHETEEQRQSVLQGVRWVLGGLISASELHQHWRVWRLERGWTAGPLDAERKTHPSLVPYADLPPAQREKRRLFVRVVQAALRAHGIRL